MVQTVIAFPLLLLPVAIALLLLHVLSRRAPVGCAIEQFFGAPVLLSWWAAALAAAVMSFPLLVRGAEQGFAGVPRRLEQVASSLGASRSRVFLRITLPLAARGILYGVVFAFARGLGEFGATTLVAGHIPGRTETLALAIYGRIEAFEDGEAALLSLVSVTLALATTGLAERFLRERRP